MNKKPIHNSKLTIHNSLKPELRFPEFSENWDIISVSDICDVYRGSTFSKADMDENGSMPCIHYGELFTKYNEVISSVYSRTNKDEGFKSEVGDILMPSSDVTPDGLAKASAIMLDNVVLGGDMNILRPKKSYNSIFLSYLLNHSKREIIKLVSGTTVKHIYPSQIITCQLPIVQNKKEQQKIASCLSSLDEVIEAHRQKLDLLKDHKKGLMQNLFPQEGEKVPKLRFKEFEKEEEWVEKTLGEICKMQAGKFIAASEIKETNNKELYPVYGGNGFRGYATSYNQSGMYSLIGRQGALCGNVTLTRGDFYATEHALVVTPNENIDTLWLFYILSYLNLNQYATGQAQPGLSVDNLLKVRLSISTSKPEQQKIASCLSSLDELITAQAEKIEQLKLHKKGLMQGLFPKIKE